MFPGFFVFRILFAAINYVDKCNDIAYEPYSKNNRQRNLPTSSSEFLAEVQKAPTNHYMWATWGFFQLEQASAEIENLENRDALIEEANEKLSLAARHDTANNDILHDWAMALASVAADCPEPARSIHLDKARRVAADLWARDLDASYHYEWAALLSDIASRLPKDKELLFLSEANTVLENANKDDVLHPNYYPLWANILFRITALSGRDKPIALLKTLESSYHELLAGTVHGGISCSLRLRIQRERVKALQRPE